MMSIAPKFFSSLLPRNHLVGPPPGLDDVGHLANNAYLHPFFRAKRVKTSVANNEAHPFGFERFELLRHRRAFDH